MNKTVYLISRGSYSDYSVMGIYSTREKAEEASRVQACDCSCRAVDGERINQIIKEAKELTF